MTPLSTFVSVAGMAALGLGMLALYQLMPKLRTRERRGDLSTPVPNPEDSHLAGVRLFWLVWTLKTSEDRPRFRRHVMLVRWLPVIGVGLLAIVPFVMQTEAGSGAADASNGPPPLTIAVAEHAGR